MEEARRAMKIAENKLSQNDYVGAKKFINKAKKFYPKLDGLDQILMMVNVYISASNKINGEADWYRVLGVDVLSDDETVKKQYKRLALLLHPDKNKFNGSEGAFKLVLEASSVLSDKVKRSCYDQKMQKPPNSDKPAASSWMKKPQKQQQVMNKFWTVCNNCKTEEYLSEYYLNKAKICRNCHQTFVVNEKSSVKGSSSTSSQQQRSKENKAPSRSNNGASSSSSSSSSSSVRNTPKAANKKTSGDSSSERVSSQESQWSSAQKTSDGTYSKKPPSSSVSFTFTIRIDRNCSNSKNAAKQGQGISKRGFENLQDKVDDAERRLKKPRTDVR